MEKDEVDFNLNFTDVTLLEADGEYEEVKCIIHKPINGNNTLYSESLPKIKEWCIKTELTIDSSYGLARFSLDLHDDGKIFIIDYDPSVGDVFYNPDIQVLTEWAQSKGWKVPEPTVTLIKSNIEFWRHFWQTLLIDSAYLTKAYGERENEKPHIENGEDKIVEED